VDVCPDDCLHLVGLSQVASDLRLMTLAEGQLGMTHEQLAGFDPAELDAVGAVMLKDETACIRCSMCASRCPTRAFSMQRYAFHRELEAEPVANPRIRYE
jgi:NAD-dependent dihydropyrimidine dehydrogenase PreA subunit